MCNSYLQTRFLCITCALCFLKKICANRLTSSHIYSSPSCCMHSWFWCRCVVPSICSWKLLHSTQVGSTEICLLACNLKFGKDFPIWLLTLKGPASSCWRCQKNCHKDLLWVFSVIGGQCYPTYLFLHCFGRHFRKQNMHILIYTWEYGVSAVFKFDNLLIFQVMLACKFHSKKILGPQPDMDPSFGSGPEGS